ncbi:envelope stress induced periplasmic protein, Spy-related protein [Psychromonas ingrahamii 37]|uniref:Envelope stress induced periplasmic protein, Spy-related protein n=1 Tax=Psychromonas ingrahamii (strain DSM 17664 / CCUG 51855 / 37) TaxID=357804 RepID=A1SUN1_PSYIN|nr:Spy/CpxP family protein refolding chaperone [Psychromonas ingrahamii]ABM03196.1 envelope stress induced periplasmic protein, Spy-related protein [Psychromonas ingrahamii 37]
MNIKTIKTMLLVLTVSVTGTSYVAAHAQHASENASMSMGVGSMNTGKMGTENMGTGHMGTVNMGMGNMGNMGTGHMGTGHMAMNFSQLNLTDQQKQEIQAITAASINGNHQNRGDMQVHHADMQALLSDDVFDKNQAKALMADHHSQMSERMLVMLKMKHQIFQLLDDQQKEQLTGMQNNMMNTQ